MAKCKASVTNVKGKKVLSCTTCGVVLHKDYANITDEETPFYTHKDAVEWERSVQRLRERGWVRA